MSRAFFFFFFSSSSSPYRYDSAVSTISSIQWAQLFDYSICLLIHKIQCMCVCVCYNYYCYNCWFFVVGGGVILFRLFFVIQTRIFCMQNEWTIDMQNRTPFFNAYIYSYHIYELVPFVLFYMCADDAAEKQAKQIDHETLACKANAILSKMCVDDWLLTTILWSCSIVSICYKSSWSVMLLCVHLFLQYRRLSTKKKHKKG